MRIQRGSPGAQSIKSITIWAFKDRVTLSAHWLPMYRGGFTISNNGGRKPNECLDINAHLYKLSLSFTLWRIGAWSRLIRWLPDNARMQHDDSDDGL